MGDFKILIENKIYPKSDQYGYIVSAKDYLENEKKGLIKGMNLNEYLKETFSSNNHYNYDNSITNSVVPLRKANMEALLYYLGTIVLIYGIYMSDAKFKSKILIFGF